MQFSSPLPVACLAGYASLVGDHPLATSRYRLGALAVVMLVALRLATGWHFYQEGVTKIHNPNWTAAGFLTGAKGPLAPYFESMVWDVDGRVRLNYARSDSGRPRIDLGPTIQIWEQYRARVADHYGFDKKQQKAAEGCFKLWEGRLKFYFLDTNKDDIIKYFNELDRRDANRRDAAHRGVESLRGQAQQIESKVRGTAPPWLADVGILWRGYDEALNKIATKDQREANGLLGLGKPGSRLLDTNLINRIIPYFDTIVGVLLMLGLFTRIAALAGAGFLFSIVLTQWPGAPGAAPVYYQTIEMLAMLVLVATAAGQFAGLDFVIHSLRMWKKTPNQETNQ